jgi:hypothetical protein
LQGQPDIITEMLGTVTNHSYLMKEIKVEHNNMTNLMNALKKDLKEIYESSIENLHSNTAQKLTDEVIRTEIDSLSSKLREQ